MKLKKRYLIILILIIFVAITGFILNQKDIKISNIFNKKYKAGSKVTFDLNSEYKCASNYKNLSNIEVNRTATDSDGNTHYFQIVLSSETNWDEGGKYVYMYDGCPWGAAAFIEKYIEITNGNTNICNDLKNKSASDSYIADFYNGSKCVTEYKYDVQYPSYGTEVGILKKNKSCDAYYDNYWNDTSVMSFSEQVGTMWFQILKKENYDNQTGKDYTDVFLINGCADSMDNFLTKYKEATGGLNVCANISELVSSRNEEWFNGHFNKSLCVSEAGYSEKSVVYECSVGFYEGGILPSYLVFGQPWNLKDYLTVAGCDCGTVKPYISSLEDQIIYRNYCSDDFTYSNVCEGPFDITLNETTKKGYYRLFGRLIDSNCTSWACDANYDYLKIGKHCSYNEETGDLMLNGCSAPAWQYFNACVNEYNETICTNEIKSAIENNFNTASINQFNSYCGDKIGRINASKITMDWQGGSSPGDLDWSIWSGADGIYTVSGIVGKTLNFELPSELKYYDHKLIGWSTDSSCPSASIIEATGKSHSFTFGSEDKTYYACYSGDIYENSLFNGTTKKTGTTYPTLDETTECSDAETITSSLTNVPMKLKSRYVRKSYDVIKESDQILGVDNNYCNVLCTDTIEIYYPNIFETVPAGQYFELMYEPEIHASRTCQTEFRYTAWKNAYEDAIEDELKELNILSEAQANYEAADALEAEDVGDCGCCETCSECGDRYSDRHYAQYVDTEYGVKSTSQSASASDCDDEYFGDERAILIDELKEKLEKAKEDYEAAVNKRIALERMNLECYSILDSNVSNTEEIKYNDVFSSITNYGIIDDDFKYKTDAVKISLDSNNYGTKSSYITSIEKDTFLTSNTIKHLNGVGEYIPNLNAKSTSEFFTYIPKLQFSYNNGESIHIDPIDPLLTETLLIEAHVKQDTGSHTNTETYEKDNTTENIKFKFYIEGEKSDETWDSEDEDYDDDKLTDSDITSDSYIDFNAYKAEKTYRTVKYYYTFHEATEYFSELHTGDISTTSNSKNISLSKKINVTDRNGTNIIIKNHVYPVSLNALAGKYETKFILTDSTNYLSSFEGLHKKPIEYSCQYEITNDALILNNELSTSYKDLKSNTLFRSVATNDLDPNDRASVGKLGENWTNQKGQAAMQQIQETEGTVERNTYNPGNLEYSFTLTPAIIKAIKKYNKHNKYDDFNLSCISGKECISKFLTELAEGEVDGSLVQDNYESINSWGNHELSKTRNNWKYYDGITIKKDYDRGEMTLNIYLSKYEKWGVLP